MKENCKKCKYFDGDEECRRFPPVYIAEGVQDSIFLFPQVSKSDWCGEFKNNEHHKKMDWWEIFDQRIVNGFERAGIETLEDLKNQTDDQLLRIKYFGRGSLTKIKTYLADVFVKQNTRD